MPWFVQGVQARAVAPSKESSSASAQACCMPATGQSIEKDRRSVGSGANQCSTSQLARPPLAPSWTKQVTPSGDGFLGRGVAGSVVSAIRATSFAAFWAGKSALRWRASNQSDVGLAGKCCPSRMESLNLVPDVKHRKSVRPIRTSERRASTIVRSADPGICSAGGPFGVDTGTCGSMDQPPTLGLCMAASRSTAAGSVRQLVTTPAARHSSANSKDDPCGSGDSQYCCSAWTVS
jgi:hypothetical protein